MPKPEDLAQKKIRTGLVCRTPDCGTRLTCETAAGSPNILQQLRCEKCGFVSDLNTFLQSQA